MESPVDAPAPTNCKTTPAPVRAALGLIERMVTPALDHDRGDVELLHQIQDACAVTLEKIEASPAAKEPRIEVVTAAALLAEDEEERTSLFREHFYTPAFGASCGPPRSGKGTTDLWIDFCLSMGLPLGQGLECVKPAPAVYFTAEDTRRRLRSRLRAMALGAGVPFEDVQNLHLIAKPTPAMHLPENLDDFKRALDPIGPKKITLDGLSRISFGRDLNSDAEMQPVVEAVEALRDHYGASVELLCHTLKSSGGSGLYRVKGAGCVPAAADHLLLYERDGKRSTLTFSDSRDDEDWSLSFCEERDDAGGVRYVLDQTDIAAITGPGKPSKLSKRDQIPEVVLRVHTESRKGVSKETLAGLLELSEDAVYRHCRALSAPGVGRIRVVEGGGPGNPTLYYPVSVPQ